MKIINIKLQNFRNHKKIQVDFQENTTLIVGNNGAGKTNLLEAIEICAYGKSPIAKHEKDIVMHDEIATNIECTVVTNDNSYNLNINILLDKYTEDISKKVKINGKTKRQLDLFAKLYTCSFYPEDMILLTGEPARRRKYFDYAIAKIDLKYKVLLSNYTKVVKQRNKVLELINKFNKGQMQLEYWNTKFIDYANQINTIRTDYINQLNEYLPTATTLLGIPDIALQYSPKTVNEQTVADVASNEIRYKGTLLGPHREDFKLVKDSISIADYWSRGQQRTAIVALKLTEIKYIEEKVGETPVLLLDDILSELDPMHKKLVLDISNKYQTIITSAEEIDSPYKTIHLE